MKRQKTVSEQTKDVDLGYPALENAYFNGSSDRIDIPYTSKLNPTSFTVEMWVQFQGGRGYRAIVTSVSGSANLGRRGYVFCVNAAQQWQFWLGSGHRGIPWIILTGSKATEGVWTHLAGTYDSLSQTMIFYVNGQVVGQWAGIEFQPNDLYPLHLGAGAIEQPGASSCFFHGSIAKVRIWGKSLSLAEIQPIAAHGSPSDRQNQVVPQEGTTTSAEVKPTGNKQKPAETTSAKVKPTGNKQKPAETTSAKVKLTGNKQKPEKATSTEVESTGNKQKPEKTASTEVESSENKQKPEKTASTEVESTGNKQPAKSPTSSQSEQSESTKPKESCIQPVLVFDGNNYVEVPYAASLNPDGFTLFCWVKVEGGQDTWRSAITSRDESPIKGYILYAGNNNKWQFWVGTGQQSNWAGVLGSEVALNTWTSLAATYDGSKMKLYVNGELVGETEANYVANSARPLRIGAGTTEKKPMFFFPGQITEVSVWSTVRNQAEIRKNMHHRLKGDEPGLSGYWILNEGSGDTVYDKTKNANHGNISGATWQQVEVPII